MGLRGLIRDLIGIYVGARLILSIIFPIDYSELVILGFITLFFSVWFTIERLGLI